MNGGNTFNRGPPRMERGRGVGGGGGYRGNRGGSYNPINPMQPVGFAGYENKGGVHQDFFTVSGGIDWAQCICLRTNCPYSFVISSYCQTQEDGTQPRMPTAALVTTEGSLHSSTSEETQPEGGEEMRHAVE